MSVRAREEAVEAGVGGSPVVMEVVVAEAKEEGAVVGVVGVVGAAEGVEEEEAGEVVVVVEEVVVVGVAVVVAVVVEAAKLESMKHVYLSS